MLAAATAGPLDSPAVYSAAEACFGFAATVAGAAAPAVSGPSEKLGPLPSFSAYIREKELLLAWPRFCGL